MQQDNGQSSILRLDIHGEQACNECKRRKARCDKALPQCGPCTKNRRHCLYEKHSKTPLTRRYAFRRGQAQTTSQNADRATDTSPRLKNACDSPKSEPGKLKDAPSSPNTA